MLQVRIGNIAPIAFHPQTRISLLTIYVDVPILTDEYFQIIERLIQPGKDQIRRLRIHPSTYLYPHLVLGKVNWGRFGMVLYDFPVLLTVEIDSYTGGNVWSKDLWALLATSALIGRYLRIAIGTTSYRLFWDTKGEIAVLVFMICRLKIPVDLIRSLRSYLMNGTEYYTFEDDA